LYTIRKVGARKSEGFFVAVALPDQNVAPGESVLQCGISDRYDHEKPDAARA
jgi:hypothetical protein